MRNVNFVIAALSVIFIQSCLKDEIPDKVQTEEIKIENRTANYASGVDSALFLVFDREGVIEYSGIMPWTGGLVRLRTGSKSLFAFSGVDFRNTAVMTLDELRGLRHRLSDDRASGGGMFCEAGLTVSEEQHPYVSFQMKRYLARIRLTRITNRLKYPLDDVSMRFLGVCLVNVPETVYVDGRNDADCDYHIRRGITGESSVFSGNAVFQSIDCPGLTVFDCRAEDMTVAPGASLDIPSHFLYSFPSSGDETLKIVVAAEIGGSVYYYPVDIGFIGMNESWEMTLDISRLGSSDPAVAVFDAQAATFSTDSFNDGPNLDIVF